MTTVLITGATGALGKAVTEYFKTKDGYEIISTSRNGEDTDFQLDITDAAQLTDIVGRVKPDLVLQLAATFTHDFDEAYSVNVEANRQFLEIVQRSSIDTRVLLIGSAAEYGLILPEENPVEEDHVLNPVSVYGLTKAWQSQLAGFYSLLGVDVVVARIFNLKGQGLSDKLFIGRLHKQIDGVLSGKQSVIELGPLSATRDYISTDDAAQQIFSIAVSGESGKVYHVASGEPVVMRDLLMEVLEDNDIDYSVVVESAEKSNRTGYDVPVIYADIKRTLELSEKKI